MGYLAKKFGDQAHAKTYFDKSKSQLDTSAKLQSFVERMKSLNLETKEIKDLYSVGENLKDPEELLIWAEGIVDLLNAKNWAKKVYSKIAPHYKTEQLKEIFETSRKIHLEGKFW